MNDTTNYKKLYPSQEYLTFDGGLDNKFERALLPENESPDCLNVEAFNGAIGTRQGAVKLNTAPAGNVAFDGLYTRRDQTGNETMVAFIGGHMKALNITTFITVPSAQSVFTIGARVAANFAENKIFIGNGVNGPYKYDGTYFTQHGIVAPPQAPNLYLTATAAGNLATAFSYSYGYTYVNSALVESNLSPLASFSTVAGATTMATYAVALSGIASGATFISQGVAARYLYRTKTGQAAFFRLAKLNDVSTATYIDTASDSALGVAAPTDNGTPPIYNAIVYHQNLFFVNDVANPNYVWYSAGAQVGQSISPYTFPSTNFFKVGDNSTDLVVGFEVYDNYVVVLCQQSIWINYMPNPVDATTWRQIKINSPYGTLSPFGMVKANVSGQDLLLHPATLSKGFVGFAAITGATLDPNISLQPVTAAGSDLQSQVIETDMFQMQSTYLKNITSISFKNRAFITCTWGTGATTNNRIYVWDYSLSNLKKTQKATWFPWSGTGHNIVQFTIYNGHLYGGTSDTSGFVYRLADTGVYSDDGTAINSYSWSKEFGGEETDTALTKDFRYLNLLVELAGSYNMNFVTRTDSDSGMGISQQINLDPGGQKWGPTMTWGVSNWDAGTAQRETRAFFGSSVRGKRLQIRFDNQNVAGQRFKVHRAQFLYNIRGYR